MPYPPIGALPATPSRNSPADFSHKMDAFLAAFPTLRAEVNALAAYLDVLALATGPGLFLNGSAANPSVAFASDPDTGMFRAAANTLAWATGGVERLRLTSAGLLTSTTAITQGQTDATADRLLKTGDFGLGRSIDTPNIDLDAAYYGFWGNSATNQPPIITPDGDTSGSARWTGITSGNGNGRMQFATRTDVSSTSLYRRVYNAGSGWRAWVRMQQPGDFGIGGFNSSVPDLNSISGGGSYSITQASAEAGNAPDGLSAWSVFAWVANATNQTQIATRYGTGGVTPWQYFRILRAGSWTPWTPIMLGSTVVGTVTTDGRGAIIERGSNSNGDYTKFADGTMICTISAEIASLAFATADGALFRSDAVEIPLPATFSAQPRVSANVRNPTGTSGLMMRTVSPTVSSISATFLSTTSATTATMRVMFTAIGRWF